MNHDNKSCELWIQSKVTLQVSEQQFGPSLRASPYHSARKAVIVVPKIFERSPSQSTWSNKDDADRSISNSGMVAPIEGGGVVQERTEMMHDRVETVHEDVTSVMDFEGCEIDSSLMLNLRPYLVAVSNSNMGILKSPRYQPIIGESRQINALANSVVAHQLLLLLVLIHSNANGNH